MCQYDPGDQESGIYLTGLFIYPTVAFIMLSSQYGYRMLALTGPLQCVRLLFLLFYLVFDFLKSISFKTEVQPKCSNVQEVPFDSIIPVISLYSHTLNLHNFVLQFHFTILRLQIKLQISWDAKICVSLQIRYSVEDWRDIIWPYQDKHTGATLQPVNYVF